MPTSFRKLFFDTAWASTLIVAGLVKVTRTLEGGLRRCGQIGIHETGDGRLERRVVVAALSSGSEYRSIRGCLKGAAQIARAEIVDRQAKNSA
jgi:hypothetical protein